jgi:arylsulfatase A-like enzyme
MADPDVTGCASLTCLPGGATAPTPGYNMPNILLIMVDQMSNPRWVPSTGGGLSAIEAMLPNITAIKKNSYVFSNYFVAATACSPSRATFLTGLYSQQTCIFVTEDVAANSPPPYPPYPPALQPYSANGFPSIGDVLSQSFLNYNTLWIGKWGLSDNPLESATEYSCNPGGDGPSDYGFNDKYGACIPTPPGGSPFYPYPYASPNGYTPNEGNSGDFLGTSTVPSIGDVPNYGTGSATYPSETAPAFEQLNSAIAVAFQNWILAAQGPTNPLTVPWFTAVSFINPHDISQYPYSFDLVSEPSMAFTYGYQPPPVSSGSIGYNSVKGTREKTTIAAYKSALFSAAPADQYPSNPDYATPWNNSDNPATQPYSAYGKPDVQYTFQVGSINNYGDPTAVGGGWYEFLNYYYWLQSCVDLQVLAVMTALQSAQKNGSFTNTVVIFTADHGDFAGSHTLRGKGGAVYDESINVPLYISFPGQSGMVNRSFVCSSVDMLPFLYSLALGNDSWRCYSSDIVNYLSGREAIMDAAMAGSGASPQRRLSNIPLANPYGYACWAQYQPYIIHTTDEFFKVTASPPNAVAFRTVDNTVGGAFSEKGPFGGGKVGIYSFWQGCSGDNPTFPDPTQASQYEFYNYQVVSPGGDALAVNLGEILNQYFTSGGAETASATLYGSAFESIVTSTGSELTFIPAALATAHTNALALWSQYAAGNGCGGGCGD